MNVAPDMLSLETSSEEEHPRNVKAKVDKDNEEHEDEVDEDC